ncbi:MAG: NAD(P)/FAD-dependent oxidoreductase [Thermoprotei archaeon]
MGNIRIAVVGLGVAGSYLVARLSRETHHEVYGFDMLPYADSKCAWGGSKHELARILRPFDIDFEEYILYEGRRLHVVFDGKGERVIPTVGLVTFDKNRVEDRLVQLAAESGAKITRGRRVGVDELVNFDLIVDATGVYRSILPKINSDIIFPNLEYRVEYEGEPPYDDFTVIPYPGLTGYTWFFPLGSRVAHVGGGDKLHRQKEYVEEFMQKYGGKKLKTIARPIRLLPFGRTQPIHIRRGGSLIVGVGEAIGTVFPLLGEGIIPSFQSSEILYNTILNGSVDIETYTSELKRKFFYFEPIYKAILAKWQGSWSPTRMLPSLFYSYIKSRRIEQRFGIKVRITDFFEIFRNT